jgi:hypothetical protein
MKTILFLAFTFIMSLSNGQPQDATDSWKVEHNGKTKLKATAENEDKNVITIKKEDLKKTGTFLVAYKEVSSERGWQRSITLFDVKDNELLKSESALLKIPNSKLSSLANSHKILKIYTWSLPTDPAVAATVRIRRIHLCTILIK